MAALRLKVTKQATSFVEDLPPKQFKQVVGTVLDLLTKSEPHDSQQLKGSIYRRVDIGEYRIVYRVVDDTVVVAVIGKRNDDEVYKILARME